MPLRRPIVAVVYAELTAPVVRAQTPPLLRALRELGHRVDAAVFTSPRALLFPAAKKSHERALAAFRDATGVEPLRRTHLPGDRGLRSQGHALARRLRDRGEDEAILLCRQPRAAIVGAAAREALASKGRGPQVVLDLRGVRDAEYLLTVGKIEETLSAAERARLVAYRDQEAQACAAADAVVCVSRAMVKHVVDHRGVDPARAGRVPNHATPVPDAETMRNTARAELGVRSDALLLAYSGTMAAWQMPHASVLLARAVRQRREDARLLFLTTDPAAAQEALRGSDLPDALVRSAPPGEAARLLCAADYGLLLREDSPVNAVSCPVKFGEYLACGVRPILTPGIGDQSALCRESDLGVVVNAQNLTEAANRVLLDAGRPGAIDLAGRDRRRAWAAENISPARAASRLVVFITAALGSA